MGSYEKQLHLDLAVAPMGFESGPSSKLVAIWGRRNGARAARDVTPQELRASIANGSIVELVQWRPAAKGDVIFIPAGTIHAIGAGIVLAENQQRSDTTFRLFDYDRARELHIDNFMHEYSFEASALFNPSIVPHPDQSGTPTGSLRFILSLRAVGEAHVVADVSRRHHRGGRQHFGRSDGPARFQSRIGSRVSGPIGDEIEVIFNPEQDISERVIFPVTESKSNGIEDARFVEFSDGGRTTYYATYTAYKGTAIRSELIETGDFLSFRMSPLHGAAARNKGMALFPRLIDGKYAMIAHQDNENLYLIYSDDLCRWEGGQPILKPQFPWEFVQIGNCGSPIELEEGWLLLTHGVGPVRKYSIGAALLDKSNPSRVLARSSEPLLRPEPSEREGYVPNVVYTCGAMRHNDQIILPYAVSDTFSNFATMKISALMQAMS
jgi:predicted GH43/DUF377 family glycosyl hydrolase